ncbi:AraC family transcriptional regulator [Saccharospirillum mangrovi]|uniref:AraC family transcriptional regulator n=1 Tax=Saccharospirillum mangrovi TaxID=2161747 RepID=UPI000D36D610|nr:AraC family transcriptional regulator [Saccharospirillum mangrovi]
MSQVRQRYDERFQRVLDYIDSHLDEPLDLNRLSDVACCSKFHFQRQFAYYYGISLYQFVQWLRLRRASFQLVYRTDRSILDIALEAGFGSAEAFSRAFKRCFEQSPSDFRAAPNGTTWRQLQTLSRTRPMKLGQHHADVRVIDFPATPIAVLTHRGPEPDLHLSIRRFIEWRKAHGVTPSVSRTFNIVYEDPALIPPEDYRMDLAASIKGPVADNDAGVVASELPAGRCAVLRHHGSTDNLIDTVRFLYGEWLPNSGEEVRNFPIFFERLSLFPDLPETEQQTDVFLPLV